MRKKIKNKVVLVALIISVIFFSGCLNDKQNNATEQVSSTPTTSPVITDPKETESSFNEQNRISELEDKINSMQQQINDLQTRIDNVGLPEASKKNLIPQVPFRIEVKFAEWQTPVIWTFKKTGELEIRDGSSRDIGNYKLFQENNTIKISSKKYDFYGLVLYDNYVTAVYDNGWIEWVKEYRVVPPKYNSITQRYELD